MTPLRLGFVPLSDCAVLAIAREKGFFRRHGLDVTLSRQVSWASIRDRLAVGALDGAQMLAGMPVAASVGIDPVAGPLLTAFSLDLNGNAVTVSNGLWKSMCANAAIADARPRRADALRRVIEDRRRRGLAPLRFAVVYPFATHNYELRYWLAAAGIDPDADVRLSVVAPPRMVEALARGVIDGFCVGEPWNSVAVEGGLGHIVATKYEIWNNSPEKVLAVKRSFAERDPDLHRALLGALVEAAAWTDAQENRDEVARILAGDGYVGAPAELLTASLTGRLVLGAGESPTALPDFHVFHRYAANFPWTSHAVWLLTQMLRWGQLNAVIDMHAAAAEVYRPDLYREAARDVGVDAPSIDMKGEGLHASAWQLAGANGAIAMGSDLFCDGRAFDPAQPLAYLAASGVGAPSVSLDALAALNS